MTAPEEGRPAKSAPGAVEPGIQGQILVRFAALLADDPAVGKSVAAALVRLGTTGALADRAAIQAAVLQALDVPDDQAPNP